MSGEKIAPTPVDGVSHRLDVDLGIIGTDLSIGSRRYEEALKRQMERSAVYHVDGVTVDVTDLLNCDFHVFEIIEDALKKLISEHSSSKNSLEIATRALLEVFDGLSDRVIRLTARLSEPEPGQAETLTRPHEHVDARMYERCLRINRLGNRTHAIDYSLLRAGENDCISSMDIAALALSIPQPYWTELNLRLRAAGILNDQNLLASARWVLRGLEVRHAVRKICVDLNCYEVETRPTPFDVEDSQMISKEWNAAITRIERLVSSLRQTPTLDWVKDLAGEAAGLEAILAQEQAEADIALVRASEMMEHFRSLVSDLPRFKGLLASPTPALTKENSASIGDMLAEAENLVSLQMKKKRVVSQISESELGDDSVHLAEIAAISNEAKYSYEKIFNVAREIGWAESPPAVQERATPSELLLEQPRASYFDQSCREPDGEGGNFSPKAEDIADLPPEGADGSQLPAPENDLPLETSEFDWVSEPDDARTEFVLDTAIQEVNWAYLENLVVRSYPRRAYWFLRTYPQLTQISGDFSLLVRVLGASIDLCGLMPGQSCGASYHRHILGIGELSSQPEIASKLFFVAALEAALFADPPPAALYALLPDIHFAPGPLLDLANFVRKSFGRGSRIAGQAVDEAREASMANERMTALVRQATEHFERVGTITTNYRPAALGLRHLYVVGGNLWRLHEIIRTGDVSRRQEVIDQLERMDIERLIDELIDDPAVPQVHCRIEGSARERLIRHLETSAALARDWIALVERTKCSHPSQSLDLPQLNEYLNAAIKAFACHSEGGMYRVVDQLCLGTLKRARAKVAGEWAADANDSLLLLRDFALDDDLEPCIEYETDEGNQPLREAMCDMAEGVFSQAIFDQCIVRDEFLRAYKLADLAGDEDWMAKLQERQERRIRQIRNDIEQCAADVENAYLLGKLDVEKIDHALLSSHLQHARELIDRVDINSLRPVRAAAEVLKSVQDEVSPFKEERRKNWRGRLHALLAQMPETEQAREDAEYLKETLESCLHADDDVAALELLERGEQSLTKGDRLQRLDERDAAALRQFLDCDYETYLTKSSTNEIAEAIRRGQTVPVDFSGMDLGERERATKGLQAWVRLRDGHAKTEPAINPVKEILETIGFLVGATHPPQARSSDPDFIFVRVGLGDSVNSCPIPAFGSLLRREIDVVVCLSQKDISQIGDYVRRQKLSERPVVLLYMHPVSKSFRYGFRRHCAAAKLSLLLVDNSLFFHLLQFRDRLRTLFDIALPFTYSQPYLMKGENVPVEVFVGREKEFKTLCDPNGGSVVYGGRQLGKSALLRHIVRTEHNPQAGVYVGYVDIDDLGSEPVTHLETENEFVRRIGRELQQIGFLKNSLPQIPSKRGNFGALEAGIKEAVQQNGFQKLLLLLDEADDFLDIDASKDFSLIRRIRSLVGSERRVKVIFAGLKSVQRYANWPNQPFAQLGVLDPIQPLSRVDGQKLIIDPLRALGFQFEDQNLVLRILSQTNYHPGLIQIFCHRLLDRLYDKWGSETVVGAETHVRRITRQDVSNIEQDPSFLQDIRNRFDWTLDLDERYKVLVYALVMHGRATDAYTRTEFQEIATSWWPQAFDGMKAAEFDELLHELVGLGVLAGRRNDDTDVERFGLRSPNILRLLGTAKSIELEFDRLINLSGPTSRHPRNYRASRQENRLSLNPLTREQEAALFSERNPFGLIFVVGSIATGLAMVDKHIRDLFSYEEREERQPWTEIKVPPTAIARGAAAIDFIEEHMRLRDRSHAFTVLDGDFVFDGGGGLDLVDDILKRFPRHCREKSRGRIIVTLDPMSYWEALLNGYQTTLQSSYVSELCLKPWTDGAIRQAMEVIGTVKDVACLKTSNRETAEKARKLTGGYHTLVVNGFEEIQRSSAKLRLADDTLSYWEVAVKDAHARATAHREDTRLEYALSVKHKPEIGQFLDYALEYARPCDGELILDKEDFAELPSLLPEEARDLSRHGGRLIRAWMEGTGLARKGSKGEIIMPHALLGIAK